MRFNNSYRRYTRQLLAKSRNAKSDDVNADPLKKKGSLSRVLSWFTLKNEQPRADKDLYAERRAGVTAGR